ncbi:cell surface protein [Flavobacteriales bacterium 33_180_T64]|nr:cell surface protein [Flavobacteriales bacterium 33_180_T64]
MDFRYTYFMLAIVLVLYTSCSTTPNTQITDVADYNAYLDISENESLKLAQQDQIFWSQKLEKTPNQFPYMGKLAASYTALFTETGQIEYLKKAETQWLNANALTQQKNPSYLKSLAYNYISQHKFKAALELLTKAEVLGENLQETRKMLFDVHLELGNYETAQSYLTSFENFSDFDYLIRLSKFSDHKGNLDAAIKYMEQAMVIAEASNLKHLKQWSYTNIADFYGHGGDIEKSYTYFLKALELNPNDAYAKKGIAWIVYSHERHPNEALRILSTVTKNYHAPDYYLLKAKIAQFINEDTIAKAELTLYKNAMQNTAYGNMYNAYNVLLFTDENTNTDTAIAMAKQEVSNRPTPQSYDLLAWSYFKSGNLDAALRIVDNHIMNKTYEPKTLYHVAEIYKTAGQNHHVKLLKEELLASIYELGPTLESEILKL